MTLSIKEAQDRLPDQMGEGKVTNQVKRVADLNPNALVMSDDFDEEDPEINAMFYGDV